MRRRGQNRIHDYTASRNSSWKHAGVPKVRKLRTRTNQRAKKGSAVMRREREGRNGGKEREGRGVVHRNIWLIKQDTNCLSLPSYDLQSTSSPRLHIN